jgi:hypothetical protein
MVYDAGGRQNPTTAARKLNGRFHSFSGVGTILGASQGANAADGRAAHRDAIAATESAAGLGKTKAPPAPSAGMGSSPLKMARHEQVSGHFVGQGYRTSHGETPNKRQLGQAHLHVRETPESRNLYLYTKDGRGLAIGQQTHDGHISGHRFDPVTGSTPIRTETSRSRIVPLIDFHTHNAWLPLLHHASERLRDTQDWDHIEQYAKERSEDEGHPLYVSRYHQPEVISHPTNLPANDVTEFEHIPSAVRLQIRDYGDRHGLWLTHEGEGHILGVNSGPVPLGTVSHQRVQDPELHAMLKQSHEPNVLPPLLDMLLERHGHTAFGKSLAEHLHAFLNPTSS